MTDSFDQKSGQFRQTAQKLRDHFHKLVSIFERRATKDFARTADETMALLSDLSDDLKKDYAKGVLDRRLAGLQEISEYFERLKKDGHFGDDRAAFHALSQLEKMVCALEGEVHRNYPRRLPQISRRHALLIVGAVAVALIFGLAARSVKDYWANRKGLHGEYFADEEFKKSAATAVHREISFDWRKRNPFPKLPGRFFSIRWTGFVNAPTDGDYVLLTRSDDGVRLWIDDEKVIDNWDVHYPEIDRALIHLTRGWHPIRLEYFQHRGGAVVELQWQFDPNASPVIIAADYLAPDAGRIKD